MDEVMESTKDLKAWTVRVPAGQANAFVDNLLKSEASSKTNILAVRAEMIFGADHLRTALYHAKRAHTDGRNSANSIPMETLLYASGERQLSTAIDKMSVTDKTEEFVVASLNGSPIKSVDSGSWMSLPDTDPEISVTKLVSFGISRTELETLKGRRPAELVMERVAAVDILKK
jgi:tRNA threonylcarbamoyladenosine modification (KEOPS) complex Cgi121 subunit